MRERGAPQARQHGRFTPAGCMTAALVRSNEEKITRRCGEVLPCVAFRLLLQLLGGAANRLADAAISCLWGARLVQATWQRHRHQQGWGLLVLIRLASRSAMSLKRAGSESGWILLTSASGKVKPGWQ